MRRPAARAPLLLLLPLVAIAPAARAQRAQVALDVGGTGVRYADTVGVAAIAASPSVRLVWPHAAAGVSGSWSQLDGGGWTTQGAVDASAFSTSRGVFSGELAGSLGGSAHHDGTRTSQLLAVARLHADGTRGGAWLGAGGGRTWDGDVWRTRRLGELGAWARAEDARGAWTLGAVATPTALGDSLRYTDVSAEARWTGASLEAGLSLGARAGSSLPDFGGARRAWGSAEAVGWFSSRTAVVASAGTYPIDPTQGYPGGRFLSLGVRLTGRPPRAAPAPVAPAAPAAPAPTGPMAVPAGRERSTPNEIVLMRGADGRQTLRVLAPGAARVELSGDFTGWAPVRMTPGAGGWWSTTLRLPAGAHQMNVRVDGAWRVPAGLPTIRDEFGGTVGVLAVP